jgi:energy-coupling factor transport system permease protein
MVSTTSPQKLWLALNKLGIPHKAAFMIAATLVFFPVIQKEIYYVYLIQKTRGFKLRFDIRHPIKSFEFIYPILIPSILLLLNRAWELSLSLEMRGLSKNRSMYKKFNISSKDIIIICLVIVVFELSILVNIFTGLGDFFNFSRLIETLGFN